MEENSEYTLEWLRIGGDLTSYRGRKLGSKIPILARTATTEQAPIQSLQRLEHEWSLARELDSAWAVQPLELTRHQGRAALILRDPGGEPLDRVIEQLKAR